MLKQKTFFTFISEIIIYLMGFVSIIIVARLLGPEPLGIVASAMALVNIFSIIGNLGFGVAHVKLVSENKDIGKCVNTFLTIKFFTVTLMIIIFLLTYFLSFYITPNGIFPLQYRAVLFIIFFAAVLTSFLDVINFTFSGKLWIAKGKSIIVLQKLVNSILRILVALLGLEVIYLASVELITVIFGGILFLNFFRGIKLVKTDKEMIRSYISFGLPALVITITSVFLSNNLDKVFINSFSGPEEVSYYSTALSFMVIFSLIGNNVNNILLPHYSNLFSQSLINQISALAIKLERYLSFFLTPIVSFIFFFAPAITFTFLGPKFQPTIEIISILSIQGLLVVLSRPYTVQLVGTNKIKVAMIIDLLTVIINVLFYLILIPDTFFGIKTFGLGAKGAAISFLIGTVFSIIAFRIVANKISGKFLNYEVLLHTIIAFTLSYIIFELFTMIKISSIFQIIFGAPAIMILFFFIMFNLKLLSKEDIKYIIDFFNILKLQRYFITEIKE